MIIPTVGRVVLFFPAMGKGFNGSHPIAGEPIPAMVAKVHGDRLVTLGGFDAEGRAFNAVQVQLLQDDEAAPEGESYAAWMPYQKSQAGEVPTPKAGGVVTFAPEATELEEPKMGEQMLLLFEATAAETPQPQQ